jgi:hypothetical protein
VRHLTDFEIQDHLDGNLGGRASEIESHIDECASCRKKVKEYQILFGQLNADQTPVLSPNFAQSVVRTIESETAVQKKFDLSNILMIGFGLIALGGTIFFVGIEKIMEMFNFSINMDKINDSTQSAIKPVTDLINVDITFVIYIGLALAIIGALDYIYRHQRRKTASYMI